MSVIQLKLDQFENHLKLTNNISEIIHKLKEISSRFSLLEEENTLSGCFVTILNLAEQYNHELTAGYSEHKIHDERISSTKPVPKSTFQSN